MKATKCTVILSILSLLFQVSCSSPSKVKQNTNDTLKIVGVYSFAESSWRSNKSDSLIKYDTSVDGTISFPARVVYEKDTLVKGTYINSFEYSGITPCGSQKSWWLDSDTSFYFRYLSVLHKAGLDTLHGGPKANPTPVFVICRGSLSKKGNYGHMGGFEYQFMVKETLEMRLKEEGDCE